MLAMRRESDPIYGSVSATTNLNLLHHHAHHHNHHHSHHSPSGQSHPETETPTNTRSSENGSSAIGESSDHTGQGAYHGHPLAQQQLQQDHQLQLHQRTALYPGTPASFGHGGFATLCNGSSANGLYPGFNSFGLNTSNGSSVPAGRSTHPAASSLDEYVDILQVQQLLLENSSSAAASASSATVANITTASCTSTTATTTTTTTTPSTSHSPHIPTVSTASFFSPASVPSSSSHTSSVAYNAKNRPKVNLQKAAEFSAAATANQLQGKCLYRLLVHPHRKHCVLAQSVIG
uniref:Uncharacterized protein n=1 Tax=Anopheles minimus TaxID=112268 RepID=A0A182VRT9_9DIPT